MAAKKQQRDDTIEGMLANIGLQLDTVAFLKGQILLYRTDKIGRFVIVFDQTSGIEFPAEDDGD